MTDSLVQAGLAQLLSGLQSMAERDSNPVLEVLPQGGAPVQMQHYPAQHLEFNQSGWKAFYHCHAEPFQFDGEHGHFHIFTRLAEQENAWAHVAGLSMDEFGQPLRWFATNRWVTDETWAEASLLQNRLAQLPLHEVLGDVETWITGMLALYSEQLIRLWSSRDVCLASIQNTQAQPALENRQYYLLAELKTELLATLEQALLAHPSS